MSCPCAASVSIKKANGQVAYPPTVYTDLERLICKMIEHQTPPGIIDYLAA